MIKSPRVINLIASILLATLLSVNTSFAASSIDSNNETELRFLTNEVLSKELDILRLNTVYRIASGYQTRSRTIRQFLYNFTASGVSLGATTTIMAHRWGTDSPDRGTLEAGAIGLVIGQAIVDGGIAIEYAIDKFREIANRKEKLDPKSVRDSIHFLKLELDSLLEARAKKIESLESMPKNTRRIILAETAVLNDIRNLALLEFARFYADEHKRKTSRNVSYINGIIATGAGGYGGSLLGLLAVTERNSRLTIPAGIGFIVSSATVMVSPITNRLFSKWSKNKTKREIRESLGNLSDHNLENLGGNLNRLSVVVNSTRNGERLKEIDSRIAVYAAEFDMLTNQMNREEHRNQRATALFKDRLISNTMIASAKTTWGTMLIFAGARQSQKPVQFNRTIAQAATVYTVGQSAWVADTLLSGKRPKSLKFPIGGQIKIPVEKLEKRIDRLRNIEGMLIKSN